MPSFTISYSGLWEGGEEGGDRERRGSQRSFEYLFPDSPHFPEVVDALHTLVHSVVHLVFSGEPADAEPDGGVGQVVVCSNGPQDVGRLQGG